MEESHLMASLEKNPSQETRTDARRSHRSRERTATLQKTEPSKQQTA